jgi:hypothetical protein
MNIAEIITAIAGAVVGLTAVAVLLWVMRMADKHMSALHAPAPPTQREKLLNAASDATKRHCQLQREVDIAKAEASAAIRAFVLHVNLNGDAEEIQRIRETIRAIEQVAELYGDDDEVETQSH